MNGENEVNVMNPAEHVVMWQDKCKPETKGWYAVNYCWDVMEGSFCGSCYFDGADWVESLPINKFSGPFQSKGRAMEWVDHNDISF